MIRIYVPFALVDYNSLESNSDFPEEIKAWIKKAGQVTKELNSKKTSIERHEIIKKHEKLWGEIGLKNWLLKLSSDKCWYTEVKHGADYPEVEHFRPKKEAKNDEGTIVTDGYYWLAFNLSNYRLSKPMPNRKKGTSFPIEDETRRANNHNQCHLDERPWFLDPLSPRDHMLLSFNDNGKSVPENGTTPLQKRRVTFTITKFGLNHGLLNRRRKEVWKSCRDLYYRYCRLTLEAERTGSLRTEASAEAALEEIIKLIKPSAEFSSVAKSALRKTGEQIAINIASSANQSNN
ncbi:hypothetical protein [Pseudomonas syringae]